MSNAPAGWYPNPEVPGEQRYWDGSAWTDQVAPVQAQNHAPQAKTQKKKRRVPLWVAITSGVAGLAIGGLGSMGGEDESLAADVASLENELAATESKVDDIQQALDKAEQDFEEEKAALVLEAEEASERAEAAEAEVRALAAQPVSPPVTEPSQSFDSNVYYENCTAARNAGAAPVYEGQPGYGPHLDRDGDGVGCE